MKRLLIVAMAVSLAGSGLEETMGDRCRGCCS